MGRGQTASSAAVKNGAMGPAQVMAAAATGGAMGRVWVLAATAARLDTGW